MSVKTLETRIDRLEGKIDPEPLVIQIIYGREGFGPVTYGRRIVCGCIQEDHVRLPVDAEEVTQ